MDAAKLFVVEQHLFSEVCCVGAPVSDHVLITNHGEHWLLLTFLVQQVHLDGEALEEEEGDQSVFSAPERIFVGPAKSEPVKVRNNGWVGGGRGGEGREVGG